MDKKEIVNKLFDNEYSIYPNDNCSCSVYWGMANGEFVVKITEGHSECLHGKRLSVGGETICEIDTKHGIRITHPEICLKDIPEKALVELENQLKNDVISEHDMVLRNSLADWLARSGYYLERYSNFFLMVKYEIKVQMLPDEIDEWTIAYLSEDSPLNNENYYLLVVDNTGMRNDRYVMLTIDDREDDDDLFRVFELNNDGILSPALRSEADVTRWLSYLNAPAFCEENRYGSTRLKWHYYMCRLLDGTPVMAGLNNRHDGMYGYRTRSEADQFLTNKILEDVFLATVPEFSAYYDFWDSWIQWFNDKIDNLKRNQINSEGNNELLKELVEFSKTNRIDLILSDMEDYSMRYGRYLVYKRFKQIDELVPKMAAFFPEDDHPVDYQTLSDKLTTYGESMCHGL